MTDADRLLGIVDGHIVEYGEDSDPQLKRIMETVHKLACAEPVVLNDNPDFGPVGHFRLPMYGDL